MTTQVAIFCPCCNEPEFLPETGRRLVPFLDPLLSIDADMQDDVAVIERSL